MWPISLSSLTGVLSLSLANGQLSGVNLVSAAVAPLGRALSFVRSSNSGFGSSAATSFRKMTGRFFLDKGRANLRSPLVLSTPQGEFRFNGGLSLDGVLAMTGSLGLTPATVRTITGGKVRIDRPLPIGFQLGCSLASPCVRNVDVGPAAETLTRLYAGKALDKLTGGLKDKIKIEHGPQE